VTAAGATPLRVPGSVRRSRGLTRQRVLIYLALAAVAIPFFVLPLWLVIVSSFKPFGEAITLSVDLPTTWAAAENYGAVIDKGHYFRSLFNSIFVSGVSITVTLTVGSLGAWAFGRSRSRLMYALYLVAIMSVLVPSAIVPTIFLMRTIGLGGTHWALILALVGSQTGLVTFLITGFVRSLPRDMEEAAFVDGASKIRTFFYVVLPMLAPVLVSTGIILLVAVWNDFAGALFLLQGEERATLPLSLYQLSAQGTLNQTSWNLVFAHLVLVSLPLIVLYALAQRRLVAGLTEGALSG
jgi:raffinose/stachyose/melibiose transport system permease protein